MALIIGSDGLDALLGTIIDAGILARAGADLAASPGNDGSNGRSGADGQDGSNGRDGANGRNGADGQDGGNGSNGANGGRGADDLGGAAGSRGLGAEAGGAADLFTFRLGADHARIENFENGVARPPIDSLASVDDFGGPPIGTGPTGNTASVGSPVVAVPDLHASDYIFT